MKNLLFFLFVVFVFLMFVVPIVIFFKKISRRAKILEIVGIEVIVISSIITISSELSYLPSFTFLPYHIAILVGCAFLFFGGILEKKDKRSTSFSKELKDAIVILLLGGLAVSTIFMYSFFFILTGIFAVIEFFIGVSIPTVIFLAYRRKYRATAYFSLFSGITMILLSVFLPTVSLNPAFKFPRFIDIGGIVLGVIFLIVSLKSYRKFTAKTQSPDKN
ncbi:MAG: hypothetical protein ACTSYM_07690 [Candidatus Baldrarchaeia archaeon]